MDPLELDDDILKEIFEKTITTTVNQINGFLNQQIDVIMKFQIRNVLQRLYALNENLKHSTYEEMCPHITHNLIKLRQIIQTEVSSGKIYSKIKNDVDNIE